MFLNCIVFNKGKIWLYDLLYKILILDVGWILNKGRLLIFLFLNFGKEKNVKLNVLLGFEFLICRLVIVVELIVYVKWELIIKL